MTNTKAKSRNNRTNQQNKSRTRNKRTRNVAVPRNPNRIPNAIGPIHSSDNRKSFLAATIAPFHDFAFGSRVPDSVELPTNTGCIRSYLSLGTDSKGGFAAVIRWHATANYISPQFTAGEITGWNNVVSANNAATTALQGYASSIRTVGYGARVTICHPYNALSGAIHSCIIPDNYVGGSKLQLPLGNPPAMVGFMQGGLYYQRVPAVNLTNNDLVVAGRPMDETAYKFYNPDYYDVNGSAGGNNPVTSSGWTTILLYGESLPASITGGICVEGIHHVECMPEMSSTGFSVHSGAAQSDIGAIAGMARASAITPAITVVPSGSDFASSPLWKTAVTAYRIASAAVTPTTVATALSAARMATKLITL